MKKYKIQPSQTFYSEASEILSSILNLTKDPVIANRIYYQILDSMSSLEENAEYNQAFGENRIQRVGKYSIVYRIRGDVVEILRVVPSSCKYIAKIRGFS